MFERNKKRQESSKMSKHESNKGSNLATVNMVSEGTEIIGTLITESDVRVSGTVDGEVKVDGKVIIASTGHVKGNVNALQADLAGRVEGEVHLTGKLILRQSAVVEGDLYTQNLVVEEGATFNGECHMRDYESDKERDTETAGGDKEDVSADSSKEDDADKVTA